MWNTADGTTWQETTNNTFHLTNWLMKNVLHGLGSKFQAMCVFLGRFIPC